MAYTEAQWNKFQSTLSPEERTSYLDYLQETDMAEYNRVVGVILQNLKTAELQSNTTVTKVLDEGTKIAGAKADKAGQKAAQIASTKVLSNFKAAEAATATPAAVPISAVESKAAVTAAANAGKTPEQLAAEEEARQAAAAQANAQLGLSEEELARLANLEKADRLALEAALLNEKNTKTQAAYARFLKKQPLSAEDKALLGFGADFEYPVDTEGNPIITDGDIPPTADDKPGKQPGAAWILSPDGKSWIKPPQPNPTDTWDDTKGWVPKAGPDTTEDGKPGEQPGAAWILSADGKSWVKPPMPTEKNKAFSWDDEKGWIGFTIGTATGEDAEGGDPDADATPQRPVGTPAAYIWDPISKTWKMPLKPTTKGNWVFDPDSGWIDTTVVPGSTGFSATEERTLALNTFKNTLALFFGAQEMTKPWVDGLYKYVSGFYKTGSTVDEAFNLALQEGRFNPDLAEFTKRFKGIYALTDLRAKGGVIQVPTIAEYFATEAKMGDLLKSSNLGDLANEDFLGDVIGKGVSATEFGNRMVAVFDRIDNASDINKKTISRFFPTLDRTQLAKALLTGEKGAKQLQQELSGYEVLSAAEQQGLGVSPTLLGGITNQQAQEIAKSGGTYASTLGQFGQISQARETEQKLAEISGVKSMGVAGLTGAVIGKSAKELKALEDLTRQEEARFSGKAGTIGSKSFASQSRANRII